jgi:sec-independent protein translocase protein TatA
MPKGMEWLIILLVVLLLFGARKLPDLARSLGSSAKEFRKGLDEGAKESPVEELVTEPPAEEVEEPKDLGT